ncbi:uncharacterized protein LOC118436867 [Folsomia candida]|uniref:uncharacterized protein LOC118436867 n=1 Tax=Folsomia candida TaxID=158441 RepID=UPI001604FA5D|nr:uncharacterized protein LOC118436867 [Folsomia candida]
MELNIVDNFVQFIANCVSSFLDFLHRITPEYRPLRIISEIAKEYLEQSNHADLPQDLFSSVISNDNVIEFLNLNNEVKLKETSEPFKYSLAYGFNKNMENLASYLFEFPIVEYSIEAAKIKQVFNDHIAPNCKDIYTNSTINRKISRDVAVKKRLGKLCDGYLFNNAGFPNVDKNIFKGIMQVHTDMIDTIKKKEFIIKVKNYMKTEHLNYYHNRFQDELAQIIKTNLKEILQNNKFHIISPNYVFDEESNDENDSVFWSKIFAYSDLHRQNYYIWKELLSNLNPKFDGVVKMVDWNLKKLQLNVYETITISNKFNYVSFINYAGNSTFKDLHEKLKQLVAENNLKNETIVENIRTFLSDGTLPNIPEMFHAFFATFLIHLFGLECRTNSLALVHILMGLDILRFNPDSSLDWITTKLPCSISGAKKVAKYIKSPLNKIDDKILQEYIAKENDLINEWKAKVLKDGEDFNTVLSDNVKYYLSRD